jgi:Mn-dependent DtxR family transcriptional regulator
MPFIARRSRSSQGLKRGDPNRPQPEGLAVPKFGYRGRAGPLDIESNVLIADCHPRAPCAVPETVFNHPDMPNPTRPTQSAEDYLERIHELIQEKGYARVVDIASSLKVKQASVTSMVQRLGDLGYLKYEKYRGLILTKQGREVARQIQRRHETLSRFFSLFGIDTETQRRDIEGIEHYLSPATVEILADLAQFFEDHPETLRLFRQSRRPRRREPA